MGKQNIILRRACNSWTSKDFRMIFGDVGAGLQFYLTVSGDLIRKIC